MTLSSFSSNFSESVTVGSSISLANYCSSPLRPWYARFLPSAYMPCTIAASASLLLSFSFQVY
ncbi:hypothetical protein GYMLUDRAFT_896811 [Collybiopsis luxurians FD-317 M1]|uniref:Uncharacterized protein n=1 Tax=Collybiopsis luxurians FD-317 M1 TaxID=944289 RepID=A0A0D0BIL9_9AGAR|nr:hypothetical protein GYMLUDRAFT_896811 [Collybiopsis luxurians FD-317 M1]